MRLSLPQVLSYPRCLAEPLYLSFAFAKCLCSSQYPSLTKFEQPCCLHGLSGLLGINSHSPIIPHHMVIRVMALDLSIVLDQSLMSYASNPCPSLTFSAIMICCFIDWLIALAFQIINCNHLLYGNRKSRPYWTTLFLESIINGIFAAYTF